MDQQPVSIVPIDEQHLAAVAQLHIQGINQGFISSLGPAFVRRLYQGIIHCPEAFGFVACQDEHVLGFIGCAESVGAVYKHVLKRSFFSLAWRMLPRMLVWRNVRNAFETLFYPAKAESDLPKAEILSVAADQTAHSLGIGRLLMTAALDEFQRRGITTVKVMVGEQLPANEYYKKLGFTLAGQHLHHGYLLNAYLKQLS